MSVAARACPEHIAATPEGRMRCAPDLAAQIPGACLAA